MEWLAEQKSEGWLYHTTQYRPGSTNDNADALSRSTPKNSDDQNPTASHNEVHCAVTGISRLPTMEEIRIKQLNNPVLGKVLYELEIILISRFWLPNGIKQSLNVINRFVFSCNSSMGCYPQLQD